MTRRTVSAKKAHEPAPNPSATHAPHNTNSSEPRDPPAQPSDGIDQDNVQHRSVSLGSGLASATDSQISGGVAVNATAEIPRWEIEQTGHGTKRTRRQAQTQLQAEQQHQLAAAKRGERSGRVQRGRELEDGSINDAHSRDGLSKRARVTNDPSGPITPASDIADSAYGVGITVPAAAVVTSFGAPQQGQQEHQQLRKQQEQQEQQQQQNMQPFFYEYSHSTLQQEPHPHPTSTLPLSAELRDRSHVDVQDLPGGARDANNDDYNSSDHMHNDNNDDNENTTTTITDHATQNQDKASESAAHHHQPPAPEVDQQNKFSERNEDNEVARLRVEVCWTDDLDERLLEAFLLFGSEGPAGSAMWEKIAKHVSQAASSAISSSSSYDLSSSTSSHPSTLRGGDITARECKRRWITALDPLLQDTDPNTPPPVPLSSTSSSSSSSSSTFRAASASNAVAGDPLDQARDKRTELPNQPKLNDKEFLVASNKFERFSQADDKMILNFLKEWEKNGKKRGMFAELEKQMGRNSKSIWARYETLQKRNPGASRLRTNKHFTPEDDEYILQYRRKWAEKGRGRGLFVALSRKLDRCSKSVWSRWMMRVKPQYEEKYGPLEGGGHETDEPLAGEDNYSYDSELDMADDILPQTLKSGGDGADLSDRAEEQGEEGEGDREFLHDSSRQDREREEESCRGRGGERGGERGRGEGAVSSLKGKQVKAGVAGAVVPSFRWNKDLDERLRDGFARYAAAGHGKWQKIAEFVGQNVTYAQCYSRWKYYANPEEAQKRNLIWTDEEMERLRELATKAEMAVDYVKSAGKRTLPAELKGAPISILSGKVSICWRSIAKQLGRARVDCVTRWRSRGLRTTASASAAGATDANNDNNDNSSNSTSGNKGVKRRGCSFLWTPELDEKVKEGYIRFGRGELKKWDKIAQYVGNNVNSNQCRHRWNSFLTAQNVWSLKEDEALKELASKAERAVAFRAMNPSSATPLPDDLADACITFTLNTDDTKTALSGTDFSGFGSSGVTADNFSSSSDFCAVEVGGGGGTTSQREGGCVIDAGGELEKEGDDTPMLTSVPVGAAAAGAGSYKVCWGEIAKRLGRQGQNGRQGARQGVGKEQGKEEEMACRLRWTDICARTKGVRWRDAWDERLVRAVAIFHDQNKDLRWRKIAAFVAGNDNPEEDEEEERGLDDEEGEGEGEGDKIDDSRLWKKPKNGKIGSKRVPGLDSTRCMARWYLHHKQLAGRRAATTASAVGGEQSGRVNNDSNDSSNRMSNYIERAGVGRVREGMEGKNGEGETTEGGSEAESALSSQRLLSQMV